ncbi:hypothetical protein [uncultured Helicobacter sp.]|uniref:hypothetical protein n=1 Tax=uncultured Helicobacter sp. TaxID=175537 RepID=UPI00263851CA|nr:hypothetical protein [uncultured Helicobacter sp.]
MRNLKSLRGIVLLPLILFIFLGTLVLILGVKSESFKQDLRAIHQRILWLDLHLLSFKEQLKVELKSKGLTTKDFSTFSAVIAEDYHYRAVVKKLEKNLEQNGNMEAFYFVDIFGVYRDKHKEFLQEFSTRRAFILRL